MRFIGTILLFCSLDALAFMEGGKDCEADAFPSSVKIFLSIQDSSGREVALGVCTGTVVDPKLVLTDSHCFERDPMGPLSPVPQSIIEELRGKNEKLVTKYQVEGNTASFAVSRNDSRQGVLVFDKPLEAPTTEVASDLPLEAGRICQVVGFSPYATVDEEHGPEPETAAPTKRTLDEQIAHAKAVREKLAKTPKRCGQTRYTGHPMSEGSDIELFEGVSQGFASVTGGDSGGGCFVKDQGKWKLVGITEMGNVTVGLDSKGKPQAVFDPAKNPKNNGIVLFHTQWGRRVEDVLALARQVRDSGPPRGHDVRLYDGGHVAGHN